MGVIRKICDPPTSSACDPPSLNVRSRQRFWTSSDTIGKYISLSFTPLLKELIPSEDLFTGFGGCWFWNCYFHALYGEDILLDLNGTGISLLEDSLDAQVSLRRQLSLKYKEKYNAGIEHSSSKIEAACAICMSIVLHLAEQPMLEYEQGPHALILCATKDQCDEFSSLLDRIGSALYLVTHNLFGPYPPMPSGRKADIVVATPPLWESVVQLSPLSFQDGMEELLYQVSDNSRWTSSSTRWRPYMLDFIAQLFFVDLDLQFELGYWPMIRRLVMEHRKPVGSTGDHIISKLPEGCQLYSLSRKKKGRDLFATLCSNLHSRWPREIRSNAELACISIKSEFTLCKDIKEKIQNTDTFRKRERNPSMSHEIVEKANVNDMNSDVCSRLVVKNALSHSRLLLDGSAFEDFALEIKRRARSFWSSFEVITASGKDSSRDIVDVKLAYTCDTMDACAGDNVWSASETIAVVIPINETVEQPSRMELLMKHLEDTLSGEMFDGSVVYCLNEGGGDFIMERLDADKVILQSLFTTTSRLLSQEPIFFHIRDVREHGKAENFRRLTTLRQKAAELSCNVNEEKVHATFPYHKFLSNVSCNQRRSVIVLRQITTSISLFCEEQNGTKPLALLYLEECCQYGKVVSYYIYEQRNPSTDSEDDLCRIHFFVEFVVLEAALEAARQFSLRFSSESTPSIEDVNHSLVPRVKLFSNEVYYEGVTAELEKLNDDDEDDFIDVSLLGE